MAAKDAFDKGEREAAKLLDLARRPLAGVDSIQYLELVDTQNLESIQGKVDRTAALCVAGYVGSTRLIDNVVLAPASTETPGRGPKNS
jgi:pantoate--beta-alanine ligase